MWTREDQREYNIAYYAEHQAEEIERVRTRMAATLQFLRDLRRRPCADCGQSFPPWVMDFDHRDPKLKSFSLAAGKALLKSREILLAEIAKCDIVCANCHAMRTYRWIRSGEVFASRAKGSSRHIARKTAYREAQISLLTDLRAVPCFDCGGVFPFFVMQFDHREPSEKRYMVSRMVGGPAPRRSWPRSPSATSSAQIVTANGRTSEDVPVDLTLRGSSSARKSACLPSRMSRVRIPSPAPTTTSEAPLPHGICTVQRDRSGDARAIPESAATHLQESIEEPKGVRRERQDHDQRTSSRRRDQAEHESQRQQVIEPERKQEHQPEQEPEPVEALAAQRQRVRITSRWNSREANHRAPAAMNARMMPIPRATAGLRTTTPAS